MENDILRHEFVKWAAHYVWVFSVIEVLMRLTDWILILGRHSQEHRLLLGSKEEFHLEAFVAKAMSLIKSYQVSRFGK